MTFESTASSVNKKLCDDCNGALPPEPVRDIPAPSFAPVAARNVFETASLPNTTALDILFVIDNSGSMLYEQTQISTRLASFTSKITNLDWRIAITSTDVTSNSAVSNGRLVNFGSNNLYLTKSIPNYDSLFSQKVRLGDTGSGNEQGIHASLSAIERNESSWMRTNAQLAIIVLSDEDEWSDRTGDPWTNRNEPSYLADRVDELYGSKKNFTFNSIAVLNDTCRTEQREQLDSSGHLTSGYIGTTYIEASNRTGGIKGSICSTDYGAELADIGNRISELKESIVLQCAPLNGYISVTFNDGSPVSNHLDGNRVIVDVAIATTTNINLKYQCAL